MAFDNFHVGYGCTARGQQPVGSIYVQKQQLKTFETLCQQRQNELKELYSQYGTDKTAMTETAARCVSKMEEIVNNLKGTISRIRDSLGLSGKPSR